jgi:lysophospholipase L1-like esterase
MAEKRTVANHLKRIVIGLSVCTMVVAFAVVVIEGASYVWLLGRSPKKVASAGPPSLMDSESWAPEYVREAPDAEQTQYRPYVIWRRAPFSGKTINVDSDGIRKTWYTSCGPGDRTIWMFGDSALWGTGSPDWETIPSHLAKLYSESGHGLCINNFGEKGWVSTQETIQLMLALKRTTKRPDLVIFYDGVSDSMVPYPSNVADSHTNFDAMKTIVEEGPSEHRAGFAYLKHSNTYHVLGMLQKQFRASAASPEKGRTGLSIADVSASTSDNYQKNIEIVEALSQHYGIRCLFVWQPVLFVGNKPRSEDEQGIARAAENELHSGTSQLIQATYDRVKGMSRPDFLYLGDVFSGEAGTMFVDFRHASPEGNRVIAGRIFKFAEQREAHSP